MTFNKNGSLISENVMALGGGDDCGYTYSEKGILNKNLSINLFMREETQQYNDEDVFGPTTIRETSQKGKINKKGKIIMNKPVVKEWIKKDSLAVSSSQTDSII